MRSSCLHSFFFSLCDAFAYAFASFCPVTPLPPPRPLFFPFSPHSQRLLATTARRGRAPRATLSCPRRPSPSPPFSRPSHLTRLRGRASASRASATPLHEARSMTTRAGWYVFLFFVRILQLCGLLVSASWSHVQQWRGLCGADAVSVVIRCSRGVRSGLGFGLRGGGDGVVGEQREVSVPRTDGWRRHVSRLVSPGEWGGWRHSAQATNLRRGWAGSRAGVRSPHPPPLPVGSGLLAWEAAVVATHCSAGDLFPAQGRGGHTH